MKYPIDPPVPTPEPPPIPDAHLRETSPANFLDALLKRPASLIQELCESKSTRLCWMLALTAVTAFALYGLLIGTFSGGGQMLVAPLKVAIGMILSALICFPSLYIFFGLTGVEISLRGLAGVLFAMLALTGLLLLGFAPVAWVFSQSTQSVAFIGTMYLAIWSIAAAFGFRLISLAARSKRNSDGVHIGVWKFIFMLVALQMTTALRPIVGVSPNWLPSEKKFFLSYWSENLFKDEPSRRAE